MNHFETMFRTKEEALIFYSAYGQIDRVRELLQDPTIHVNAWNSAGETALHHACCNCHHGIVELLLDHGADIEGPSLATNHTPLMIACKSGGFDTVELLLDYGANANAQCKISGNTPLHCVFLTQFPPNTIDKEIVEELLQYGADPNIKNYYGEIPLDYARKCGRTDIVHVFTEHREMKQRAEERRRRKEEQMASTTSQQQTNLSTTFMAQIEECIAKQVASMEHRIAINIDSKIASLEESISSQVQGLVEKISSLSEDKIDSKSSPFAEQDTKSTDSCETTRNDQVANVSSSLKMMALGTEKEVSSKMTSALVDNEDFIILDRKLEDLYDWDCEEEIWTMVGKYWFAEAKKN